MISKSDFMKSYKIVEEDKTKYNGRKSWTGIFYKNFRIKRVHLEHSHQEGWQITISILEKGSLD